MRMEASHLHNLSDGHSLMCGTEHHEGLRLSFQVEIVMCVSIGYDLCTESITLTPLSNAAQMQTTDAEGLGDALNEGQHLLIHPKAQNALRGGFHMFAPLSDNHRRERRVLAFGLKVIKMDLSPGISTCRNRCRHAPVAAIATLTAKDKAI